MAKTIAEINEKIKKGRAVVVDADHPDDIKAPVEGVENLRNMINSISPYVAVVIDLPADEFSDVQSKLTEAIADAT